MLSFSSVKFETSGGRTLEYIDDCHPNLLMYRIKTGTGDEYESGFVRNQGNRDSQLKGDHIAAERGHMYLMIEMSDLFGFEKDIEKILYGLGFKLILKRIKNDRALVNANPAAVADDGNIDIRDITRCVPSIDPSKDSRIIVQKGLKKRNNIDLSYYERKKFCENVPSATIFLFDFSMESGIERPKYMIIDIENINY